MNKKALLVVLSLIFLEWLDFSLYLYLAKSVFASQFFPPSNYNLFLSFALFAAGFLARPIGGWIFGRAADSDGRRKPMIVSAALMGTATVAIALLPNYSQVGIIATWGLLLCRLAQGLALGGEINNSAMFLIEHHSNKPLVAGSFVAASGACGMFLGGAIAALLQSFSIEWLWRIIFVIVGFISIWVCSLRKKLIESPEFSANKTPIWEILKEEWQGIINIAILGAFVSIIVYICNAYWVSYAADQGFWSGARCAFAGSIAQLFSALVALPLARLVPANKVLTLVRCSMLLSLIGTPLLFLFTTQSYIPGVIFGLICYVFTNALICSSLFYFLYLQLPAIYRCRGVSTVWAISASIGAISLPIAEQANLVEMPWVAPLLVCSVAFIGLLLLYRPKLTFQSGASASRI